MWSKLISTQIEVHKEKKARKQNPDMDTVSGDINPSVPHLHTRRRTERENPTNLLRETKPHVDPSKGSHRGLPAPAPTSGTKWDKIIQSISPGHHTNGGLTAWGSGTLYRMQGKSILGLYQIYGVFCEGNKSWEREKSRWFGKEEVWKLGRKGTKGADVDCFLPIYFSSCALCLAIPVCPAFPIHTLLLRAYLCLEVLMATTERTPLPRSEALLGASYDEKQNLLSLWGK